MAEIIAFPPNKMSDDRAAERLRLIHFERRPLDELFAELGNAPEWLESAIVHLKTQISHRRRSAGVSVAAIHLVLMKLEEFEHGGSPWSAGSEVNK